MHCIHFSQCSLFVGKKKILNYCLCVFLTHWQPQLRYLKRGVGFQLLTRVLALFSNKKNYRILLYKFLGDM